MTTVSVNATKKTPSHHLSVDDGTTYYGMMIEGGKVESIREYPYSPSSMQFNQGRSGYSSFEMPYSSIDQMDWTGGMGQEHFEDPTKYDFGYNIWSASPNILLPAPAAKWGNGYRDADMLQFGDEGTDELDYNSLWGAEKYLAQPFTASASYNAKEAWIFAKKVGSPSNLTISVHADDGGGKPGSVVTNLSIVTGPNGIEGTLVGEWTKATFTTAAGLTSGNDYHFKISGGATADSSNYWEIAGSSESSVTDQAWKSSDNSNWTALTQGTDEAFLFFRLTAADDDAEMHHFIYKRGFYAASEPSDGTAGAIYMNGDRGVATGTHSATTLQDTTKSWTTNEWKGAWVYIWKGTGRGQWASISSNDGNTLTVSSATAFAITPADGAAGTGSEYIIRGSEKWTDVTPTGTDTLAKPVTDVITLWDIIYLAQGDATNILRVREYNDEGVYKTFWAAAAIADTAQGEDTNNNKATFLEVANDPVHENIIWRIQNSDANGQVSISRADDVTWNDGGDGTGTDLTFPATGLGGPVPIGIPDYQATGLIIYNNKPFIGKEDSLWYIENDGSYDRAYPMPIGLDAMISNSNCKAMITKDLFLFFNWAHSLERMYGSTVDDIGPWRGKGLPNHRQGVISHLEPAIAWIFAAMDAGKGNAAASSVLLYHNGWHPLFSGISDRQIRSSKWESIDGDGAVNRLWFEYGGDFMYMEFPRNTLNMKEAIRASKIAYSPESYIVQSRMDAGYSALEKYFNKVHYTGTSISDNDDGLVYCDYTSEKAFTSQATNWVNAGDLDAETQTDFDAEVPIALSRKRFINIRTRMYSREIDYPAMIYSIVLDAVARKPVKYNWDVPIVLQDDSTNLLNEKDHDPDTMYSQFQTWAGQAQALTLRSVSPSMDNKTVFIEPPSPMRRAINWLKQKIYGYCTITLREL